MRHVLVVHGIGNHCEPEFRGRVNTLQSRVGSEAHLAGVYWADLGGQSESLTDVLPKSEVRAASSETRADATTEPSAHPDYYVEGDEQAVDFILARALTSRPVKSYSTRSDNELRTALESTQYLKKIRDPDTLVAIGQVLAASLESAEVEEDDPYGQQKQIETRGAFDAARRAIFKTVKALDDLIGRVSGSAAGMLNHTLRSALSPAIAQTFGDIIAYQNNRPAIHERLFQCLDAAARGYGTASQPITVAAHSLGGLVVLDALLGATLPCGGRRTLHVDHLVTFGSQAGFFHIISPRPGLPRYSTGKPVTLPGSVLQWTNLWHPMDVLAFLANPVFRLADGSHVRDVRVEAPASEIMESGAWMHSVYWEHSQLIALLSD